jgi:hypothetical protein
MTRTVRVLPRWQVLHQGLVYGPDEVLDLPILQACEWSAWGSVEPVFD